jgi:iron complex outermembrane recepter protein
MVPGLQVAQLDANIRAIGTRGFSERFSNKMLVMIDGRTVYSPSFGGVYRDIQDVVLEVKGGG